MSRPIEPKPAKPDNTSSLQNQIANWALERRVKDKSTLGLHDTGKDIATLQGHAKTPETAKLTPPQIERTQAPNTGSSPQTTPKTKQDLMPAYSPKKRTVNPERFLR